MPDIIHDKLDDVWVFHWHKQFKYWDVIYTHMYIYIYIRSTISTSYTIWTAQHEEGEGEPSRRTLFTLQVFHQCKHHIEHGHCEHIHIGYHYLHRGVIISRIRHKLINIYIYIFMHEVWILLHHNRLIERLFVVMVRFSFFGGFVNTSRNIAKQQA